VRSAELILGIWNESTNLHSAKLITLWQRAVATWELSTLSAPKQISFAL
jgi:hypothetical protein